MCDLHTAGSSCEPPAAVPGGAARTLSRRHVLGAVAASAATVTAGSLIGRGTAAQAAPASTPGLSVTLLGANGGTLTQPFDVYGPGPAGEPSLVPSAPGPLPGTAALTALANQAFAASSSFFIAEHIAVNPASLVTLHEVMPPASAGASLSNPAPAMAPFTVMENNDVRVTAILVPHGAVYPAYAYRFDTDYGSVVFSGDTTHTPNIPALAQHADLLVHEVVDLAAFAGQCLPPALLAHLGAVHTDVTLLGGIAAESGVRALAATHLGPGDPAVLPDQAWRKALRDSARQADFGGPMILGMDLMQLPVRRR